MRSLLAAALVVLAPALASAAPYVVKLTTALDQRNLHVPAGATCQLLQVVDFPERIYKVLCLGIAPPTRDGSTELSVFDVEPNDAPVVVTPAPTP